MFCFYFLLCSGALKEVRPRVGIVELRAEHWSEIGVREVRRIVILHEFDVGFFFGALPVPPEPFAAEAGNAEHAPVEKDAHFRFVVPRRQRPFVDRVPIGLILSSGEVEQRESDQKEMRSHWFVYSLARVIKYSNSIFFLRSVYRVHLIYDSRLPESAI